MINEFFNKSKYTISKISDQFEVRPDTTFTLYTIIVDSIKYTKPTSVSAVLVKTTGRDQVELPTVVTISNQAFSATPALVDWDGQTSLALKVTIDSTQVVYIPLVKKG